MFSPSYHIPDIELDLKQRAASKGLSNLFNDFKATWLQSWKPHQSSDYGMPIRTYNDVEAWQSKIYRKAKRQTPFYLLIQLLQREASNISTDLELLKTDWCFIKTQAKTTILFNLLTHVQMSATLRECYVWRTNDS